MIELYVAVPLIGILAAMAIVNFSMLKGRAYEATAQADSLSLKTALYAEEPDPDLQGSFQFFDLAGPGSLPAPLTGASLSRDVNLNYVIKMITPDQTLVMYELTHNKGRYNYRYSEVNGSRTEQVISK